MAYDPPADVPRLTDYAPATPEVDNAWRLHGLAKAILQLAAGKRLTAHQHAALAGIVEEAERLP